MNNINNEQFLKAIFRDQYPRVHVCSFLDDPTDIPQSRRGLCWAGGSYGTYPMLPGSNQFYTVSLFALDDDGKSRRRKELFEGCYVIGADDVKEKLPLEQINRLPPPSIIIKSSNGSEQWLWILRIPCTDRSMLDNLMDGLIAKGLAPDGKDPGMKGVTRYLRLPEGFNTKAKRIAENGGTAPQCKVIGWNPQRLYDLEQLAEPFGVDLHAVRADTTTFGTAAEIQDHPILAKLNVKSMISPGKYDVTCPWVDNHTNHIDDGAAIFTNEDGSIGFECHHDCTQNAVDVIKYLEEKEPGFKDSFAQWTNVRRFAVEMSLPAPAVVPPPPPGGESFLEAAAPAPPPPQTYEQMVGMLSACEPSSDELLVGIKKFCRVIDRIDPAIRLKWQNRVRILGQYNKTEFDRIVKTWRREWNLPDKIDHTKERANIFKNSYYVGEMNQIYTPAKRMFQSVEGFSNAACHLDENIRALALTEGRMTKVDKVDYVPGQPLLFVEDGTRYINGWTDLDLSMAENGDLSPWDEHFKELGWEKEQAEIERRLAFTIRHPDVKINTAMVLGGHQGIGKDWILYPLVRTMGQHSTAIQGEALSGQFGDFLLNCKHLHINELQVGSNADSRSIHNKLKPIIAAPPNFHNIDLKGKTRIMIRNIVNVTIATNDRHFLHLDADDRRYWALWSDLVQLDKEGNPLPGVEEKWTRLWDWMESVGWKYVLYRLLTTNLNDFNPKALPKMTNYMHTVKELSKDSAIQVLDDLMEKRVGMMGGDLATVDDILGAMRMDALHAKIIGRMQGPQLSKVMHTNNFELSFRVRINDRRVTVFVLRNEKLYRGLTAAQIVEAYKGQVELALTNDLPTML